MSKYAEQFGTARAIVPCRDFIVKTIQTALRNAGSHNLDAFKKAVVASMSEE